MQDELANQVEIFLPSSNFITTYQEANLYWKIYFAGQILNLTVKTKDRIGTTILVPIRVSFDNTNHAYTNDPNKSGKNNKRLFDIQRAQAMDHILETICNPKYRFYSHGTDVLLDAIKNNQHYTVVLRWSEGGQKYNFCSAHFKNKGQVDRDRQNQRTQPRNNGPLSKKSGT